MNCLKCNNHTTALFNRLCASCFKVFNKTEAMPLLHDQPLAPVQKMVEDCDRQFLNTINDVIELAEETDLRKKKGESNE